MMLDAVSQDRLDDVFAVRATAATRRATTARVLVLAPDDAPLARAVRAMVAALGEAPECVADVAAVAARLAPGAFDAMVVVAGPARTAGLAALTAAHRVDPQLAVIIADHDATVRDAAHLVRAGAADVVAGATLASDLRAALTRVLEPRRGARSRARSGVRRTDAARAPAALHPTLVGSSPALRELLERVALVAPTRATVLLTGETGTGKERVAEAIHRASSRAAQPFVRVHCAALAETLLESELFGHEKGAFTGAHARREGRFKLADGGTLLLDEIGEVSPAIQVKLLRVLQERQFERVGGAETLTADVRLVAATNRDLRAMVNAGTFRADLYYRLNVVELAVPPLRARREDIPALLEHHLARLAASLGVPPPAVAPAALERLMAHAWPGNVRELENVVERALVLSRGRELTADDLDPRPRATAETTA